MNVNMSKNSQFTSMNAILMRAIWIKINQSTLCRHFIWISELKIEMIFANILIGFINGKWNLNFYRVTLGIGNWFARISGTSSISPFFSLSYHIYFIEKLHQLFHRKSIRWPFFDKLKLLIKILMTFLEDLRYFPKQPTFCI